MNRHEERSFVIDTTHHESVRRLSSTIQVSHISALGQDSAAFVTVHRELSHSR